MEKTTLYMPPELKRRLAELAGRRGTSQAALIRRAIETLLAAERGPRPRLPLFRGPDPTLAEGVDEALEGFGG
ncbi:MAG TPA: CopG family transcriptional regulator [Actinomycetota bacterium]|nr:CopG family transcriptional regulator [Actinomycetota bacterium]